MFHAPATVVLENPDVSQTRVNHEGGLVKTEEDPLDPNPPRGHRRTLEAIRYVEQRVTVFWT